MKIVRSLTAGTALLLASALQSQAAIAYGIDAGTAGTQAYGGALGNDFDVVSTTGISVTRLGVFDDLSDGLNATITVGIFDRTDGSLVGSSIAFSGNDGSLEGGSRFTTLVLPINLPAGFQGSVVAQGYNGAERNGNGGTGSTPGTTDDGGGAISFVGGSRFGPAGVFAYPTSVDGGPANRYHAGNFDFDVIPEPSSLALLLGAFGFFGLRRRK
ncbi:MAG: PEP-CTERM sorting domain-containing protein [Roseibacillus sp.]|nr:PEP-CTERM sorting domain-containing protein [Roseibacillus sp.]